MIISRPDFPASDAHSRDAALAALPAFGPARQASLAAALEASRAMPSSLLLRGLSIRLVGDSAAAALGRAFPRLADLTAASREAVQLAAGVGPAVAESVVEFFGRPSTGELLQRLQEAGVECIAGGGGRAAAASPSAGRVTSPGHEASAGAAGPTPLAGVSGLAVCVTGSLQGPDGTGLKRSEMQAGFRDRA
ncbi:hypothetical protein GPECTOR_4g881 [Gonium pectorale]|uniref:DisA/LigA helix-hairpin-helix motif domain-containing protein n=1 Tax=Gonium pectorale TaxID=33097 RepID=A0A150GZQ6_GONPE|nr:hypothetical protein GPECTOR_4g881 [Gonium pectorale]|eukprot:KXZ54810.1 hypothetical protein GPECTOR_4g881 [Gonium pectorale]